VTLTAIMATITLLSHLALNLATSIAWVEEIVLGAKELSLARAWVATALAVAFSGLSFRMILEMRQEAAVCRT
jgi:hypothetical protein